MHASRSVKRKTSLVVQSDEEEEFVDADSGHRVRFGSSYLIIASLLHWRVTHLQAEQKPCSSPLGNPLMSSTPLQTRKH